MTKTFPTVLTRTLVGLVSSAALLLVVAGCDDSGNPPAGSVSAKAPGESAAPPAPAVTGKKGAKADTPVKTAKSGLGGDR